MIRPIAHIVLAAAAATGFAAAAAKESVGGPQSDTHSQAVHAKHWAYEDGPESAGPAHWGDLPGNGTCSAGKLQSPIALATSAATSAQKPALSFDYHASKLSMINNGHTIQFNMDSGSSVTDDGTSYRLAQFHFHAPSEHTLDGKSFPLEIHLVHVNAEGKPALVVGVFVREGKFNPTLETAFRNLPGRPDATSEPAGATINASGVLPVARGHFAYDGSLTTPPCSEGIRWRVMRDPIEMSAAQIEAFRSLPHLAHTARPVQPAGGRTELLISAP